MGRPDHSAACRRTVLDLLAATRKRTAELETELAIAKKCSDLLEEKPGKRRHAAVEVTAAEGARCRAPAGSSIRPRRQRTLNGRTPRAVVGALMRSIRFVYTPPFNREDDEVELRKFVAEVQVGWLVTNGAGAPPAASFLPVLWIADTVIAHVAKANPQWREIADNTPALLIVTGPDAYVSPAWYAAKAEHGKVVPTWNYSAVHLTGMARVHEDTEWLRSAVTELTDHHEGQRRQPWHVSDAPAPYIEGQLRGIVGIELAVTAVEGKAKLSQNRSIADREGVIAGLREEGRGSAHGVADAMAASLHD